MLIFLLEVRECPVVSTWNQRPKILTHKTQTYQVAINFINVNFSHHCVFHRSYSLVVTTLGQAGHTQEINKLLIFFTFNLECLVLTKGVSSIPLGVTYGGISLVDEIHRIHRWWKLSTLKLSSTNNKLIMIEYNNNLDLNQSFTNKLYCG